MSHLLRLCTRSRNANSVILSGFRQEARQQQRDHSGRYLELGHVCGRPHFLRGDDGGYYELLRAERPGRHELERHLGAGGLFLLQRHYSRSDGQYLVVSVPPRTMLTQMPRIGSSNVQGSSSVTTAGATGSSTVAGTGSGAPASSGSAGGSGTATSGSPSGTGTGTGSPSPSTTPNGALGSRASVAGIVGAGVIAVGAALL